MLTLQTKIEKLYGVGPHMSKRLTKLGIEKIEDLLYHFPFRYEDFSKITPISKIVAGQDLAIKGKILQIKNSRSPRRRIFITEALIQDQTGSVRAVWFNQPFLTKALPKGTEVILAGKMVRDFRGMAIQSPVYEKVKAEMTHLARIVPVYPETEGLTSKWLRTKIKPLLSLTGKIADFLPEKIKKEDNLVDLSHALREIHFPSTQQTLAQAKRRLSFDELFLIQLKAGKIRQSLKALKAPKLIFDQKLIRKLVGSLPFKLTNSQRKAAWEIILDLEKSRPMNRLLEGDVGSGKTVVAAIAMLLAAHRGYQSLMMAPTEILAIQHFGTLKEILKDFSASVALLTSAKSDNSRGITVNKKKLLNQIKKGKVEIIVGTHALLSEKTKFHKIGLVVVDEQHRFGVKQRAALRKKSNLLARMIPHLLSMTATPIPRTLSLALYGDLDISILDEMPPGRQKIKTSVISPSRRGNAYQFIRHQIKSGNQVFVICPLIEESEKLEVKAAKKEYERLSKEIFPDLRIGLLHGQMKTKDKEKEMIKFKDGKVDLLVSTAVVEVGVDVPNATIMMIEGAERFGLAQLHQFRGRVGRGKKQSYCLLLTDIWGDKIKARLGAMVGCNDGFVLAEKDLAIRGPGEIYGVKQHGRIDLRMANLTDVSLIKETKKAAEEVLREGIEAYPLLGLRLRDFIEERHLE